MKQRVLMIALALVLANCGARHDVGSASESPAGIVVLISANAEWKVVREHYSQVPAEKTPWGDFFRTAVGNAPHAREVLFFHGGWGKVAAAGSSQYCIDRWRPGILINLGTCGGFEGDIKRYEIVLVDRTIIYDIVEAMGDSKEAIEQYATSIDLEWLGAKYPTSVRKTLLVSADRDIMPSQIAELKRLYHAVAGDWETGAVAYTSAKNGQRLLILRGVSDLVSSTGGEAYGNVRVFEDGTRVVMTKLIDDLPKWLDALPEEFLQTKK